ncbi:hypothetical protein D3C87_1763700 [compost metagenome]
MLGENGGNLVIEMGALRQHDAAIAVLQPFRCIGSRSHHLLQAEDIGIGRCQIVDQRRMDAAAPDIQ